jgi:hypothetical protein
VEADEAIGAILKLAVGLVAMLAAFFIWSARKLIAVAGTPNQPQVPQDPGSGDRAPFSRGSIETKTMARRRVQK